MVGKIFPSEVSNFLKRQNFMAIIFAYIELVTTSNLLFIVLSVMRYLYYTENIKIDSYLKGKKQKSASLCLLITFCSDIELLIFQLGIFSLVVLLTSKIGICGN